MSDELAKAPGRYHEAFRNYENLLRAYISSKQMEAKRFSTAFAPRTRFGLFLRNQVVRACAILGLSKQVALPRLRA
jgi:2-polyprenyl-6-methoxyphenol hydroxylase-like FAD-dependent oxidoreductase